MKKKTRKDLPNRQRSIITKRRPGPDGKDVEDRLHMLVRVGMFESDKMIFVESYDKGMPRSVQLQLLSAARDRLMQLINEDALRRSLLDLVSDGILTEAGMQQLVGGELRTMAVQGVLAELVANNAIDPRAAEAFCRAHNIEPPAGLPEAPRILKARGMPGTGEAAIRRKVDAQLKGGK